MKQGSADDPFADDPTDEDTSEDGPGAKRTDQPQSDDETVSDTALSSGGMDTTTTPQKQSLPYIHARNGVKDGRTQRPVFLRPHIEEGIDDLVDQMEDEFGETVYKTDITEAAMVVAQENPELVLATLEEWGYGWS